MTKRVQGVGALVYASCGDWMTVDDVLRALPDSAPAAVRKAIANLTTRGCLLRRNPDKKSGRYEHQHYKANPALPVGPRTGPRGPYAKRASSTTAAGEKAERAATSECGTGSPVRNAPASRPAAVSIPAMRGQTMTASLGVLCDARPPANPAQGRIEDALAAVLHRDDARTLDTLLAMIPAGWSRSDVIGALADGVIAGWVGAGPGKGAQVYWRKRKPPAVRIDPLVERFKTSKLRERCQALDVELVDVLADARECDAPPELVRALVDLRQAAARTVRQLEG